MANDRAKKDDAVNQDKSPVALDEEKILSFWREINAFEKSLSKKAPKGNYVFYDGPPFATGLPHYGHILGSAVKDTVARYQTMRGYRVERKWGWDCHGLPIENIVEKDLKVSGKKEIEALGVDVFNEYAKSKVLDYVSHWRDTVERIGRWVDFDGSYKTMDNTFIESVWWALSEINKKGLMYEGTRVLPYCPRCETPIANSEIAMDNSYKDITDISVYVKLELVDAPGTFLLAWTTTPWTLPGNTAAAVNEEISYVQVRMTNEGLPNKENYILAKDRLAIIKEEYEVVREFKGKELVGKKYKPIFGYYANDEKLQNHENGWKVYSAPYVTTESGTGIVHLAPAYGAEDMELAEKYNIPFVRHVGPDGKFTHDATDFEGEKAKPKEDHQSGDVLVIKDLAHRGLLFAKEKIIHSYPHCHRCETPLYYFALPAWFIDIQSVKKKMLKHGEDINWIPEHLKHGRFGKSMEAAPDWNISRNRYWASPLPIWKCEKCNKTNWVSSVEELKKGMSAKATTLVVVRHTEAESNVKKIHSSIVDDPIHLTPKGIEDAEELGKKIKKENIDLVFASPFVRTTETAKIISKAIDFPEEKIIYDKRIQEFNFGILNGKTHEEYTAFWVKIGFKPETRVPEGESYMDVKRRFGEFLYEINREYPGKKILLVTHGGGLEVMTSIVEGLDSEETMKNITDSLLGELRKYNFVPLPHNKNYELDLHRPYIDEIKLKCDCGGEMKRIPEVLDCWFESGSMPFAQKHYPFENKDWFKKNFPSQFIAEYIAQTRTWFYYLHAVSSILFGKAPFENVVTTGTVLAEDGEKMSKSKGNFPNPQILFDKYGVDALRFYMLSSPLMKSEDLNFSEKGVDEIYKKNILRIKNVVSFFEMYKGDYQKVTSDHVLDQWILARLDETVRAVTDAMELYKLDQAHPPLSRFVDDLSTWYLRRSRDRMKEVDQSQNEALSTLSSVLKNFAIVCAPFCPFLSEEIYQKLKDADEPESVHLAEWPEASRQSRADVSLIKDMETVRALASLALEARAEAGVKVRQPLRELRIKNKELGKKPELLEILRDEVNVKEIIIDEAIDSEITLDTEISEELKAEGDLREIVRAIQDARKQKGLAPRDSASGRFFTNPSWRKIVETFETEIKKTCNLSEIEIIDSTTDEEEFRIELK